MNERLTYVPKTELRAGAFMIDCPDCGKRFGHMFYGIHKLLGWCKKK